MYRISGCNAAALAAAITLSLACAPVRADVSLRQMPGKGTIVSGHVSAGVAGAGTQTIVIGNASDTGGANAVINWGSGTDINPTRPAGFNLGPNSHLAFNDGTGGYGAAVLNIDSSGSPSQLYGQLVGNGTSIFVANSNGIIVGAGARISSTAGVGLIGNTTLAGTGSDFGGTASSIAYTGTGGDVTVARGATISGTSVLIAGGGNVNVDLSAFTGPSGSTSLSAGLASANAGAGGANNTSASLTTAGALPSGRSLGGFGSGGTALNTGTLALGDYSVAGLFTNQGTLTIPTTNGAMWNQGTLTSTVGTTFTSLTNDGTFNTLHGITVQGGGNLVNNGTITGAQLINVIDGSINNTGSITGVVGLSTASDSNWQPGA